MKHIDYISSKDEGGELDLIRKATGRYYTGEQVGRVLVENLVGNIDMARVNKRGNISVVDPFGGDGRLLHWFVKALGERLNNDVTFYVEIWDRDGSDYHIAKSRIEELRKAGLKINFKTKKVDSFRYALNQKIMFDIVITNPPWEVVKPDRRELLGLLEEEKGKYKEKLKEYDEWLNINYPISRPRKKFAGWGTNLSRVGFELCTSIVKDGGLVGCVMPASFLADSQSYELRKRFVDNNIIYAVFFFSAESRAYKGVDSTSCCLTFRKASGGSEKIRLSVVKAGVSRKSRGVNVSREVLRKIDYIFPFFMNSSSLSAFKKITKTLPSWADLERSLEYEFWSGREVDETGLRERLTSSGKGNPFVKGRMVSRYKVSSHPQGRYHNPERAVPRSALYRRIVWRDVSRPTQKRRMIATIIPNGWVAGNSLGVAHFKDSRSVFLESFLAVINSIVFEFQLRAHLATSHISLSSIRKVRLPDFEFLQDKKLYKMSKELLSDKGDEYVADAYVAKILYQLTKREYEAVLGCFDSLSVAEKALYKAAYEIV